LIGIRNDKYSVASQQNLISLACTIVRRKVVRKWRLHRRQLSPRTNPSNDRSVITQLLSSICNPHSGPEEIAAYNNQLSKLCRSLDDVELAMLELRLEGYSTGEVSEKLGIHPVAIRVRWQRLRQRLDAARVFSECL
jgi:DNA-directed RNA polymerase specialized sigma24 family protein